MSKASRQVRADTQLGLQRAAWELSLEGQQRRHQWPKLSTTAPPQRYLASAPSTVLVLEPEEQRSRRVRAKPQLELQRAAGRAIATGLTVHTPRSELVNHRRGRGGTPPQKKPECGPKTAPTRRLVQSSKGSVTGCGRGWGCSGRRKLAGGMKAHTPRGASKPALSNANLPSRVTPLSINLP
jgi:hypothetical protein